MLHCLEADDNALGNLEGLYHLPHLKEVPLKNNQITKVSDLSPLAMCPKLTRLDLRGNPVTKIADTHAELAELLPSITDLLL